MHQAHDRVFKEAAATSRFRDGMIAGGLVSASLWTLILCVFS